MMPPSMRSALAVFAVALAGCPSTTVVTDLAIVTGCHQPEACLFEGAKCNCNRSDITTSFMNGGCLVCEPNVQIDTCGSCGDGDGGTCREPSQICYGRGPVCPGAGSTCVPAGAACGDPRSAPPEPVQSNDDGGVSAVEPRCAYTDDVCCPGAGVDLGVPDLSSSDLSAVVSMDLASSD
jgi:hypothetical protein